MSPPTPARRREAPPFSSSDLERAARLLLVRSRRDASSAFAGSYRSAFQGGGVEFEESRPYVPGDDVRFIDWNALARTGVPYVKRFREERDQTVWIAVDVSGSMAFASGGPTKAAAAAHAAALVTVAAGRAGDRVGLVTFDRAVREVIPPGRGEPHTWRVLRTLVAAAGSAAGGTGLAAAVARIGASARRRAVVFLVSDFRDDAFFAPAGAGGEAAGGRCSELVALAVHHDVSALVVHDPREDALPAAGRVRLRDPERPARTFTLSTRSRHARARYRAACEMRRRALLRRLRGDGVHALALRSDRDPLHALARFFAFHRGARARRIR